MIKLFVARSMLVIPVINMIRNWQNSSNNIAGILNSYKNILGMMPHPERLIDPILSGEDGSMIFESLLKSQ